jgi:hypothetical protein
MPGMGPRLAEDPLRDDLVATGDGGYCAAVFPLPVESREWLRPASQSASPGYAFLQLSAKGYSTQVRIPMMIEDVVNGAGKAVDT